MRSKWNPKTSSVVADVADLRATEDRCRACFSEVCLIGAIMGMRRGEVFGLKWADVDFGRAALHVRRSSWTELRAYPRQIPHAGPYRYLHRLWKSSRRGADATFHSGNDAGTYAQTVGEEKRDAGAESLRLWFPGQNPLSVPLLFPWGPGTSSCSQISYLNY
jgi:integrase